MRTNLANRMLVLPIALASAIVVTACETSSSDRSSEKPSHPEHATGDRAGGYEIPGVRADAETPERLRPPAATEGDASGAPTADRIGVEIPAGDRRLAGTLHVPSGARDDSAPGLILVHASGPLSRDAYMSGQFMTEFGFELPVFRELARRLAGVGIVVLRYDKRTCHASRNDRCEDNGYPPPASDVTLRDFLDDASRATEWLRDQPYADPERIVVLGHGQGGTLVPKLLRDCPELAAGVLVGTAHRSVDELYRAQAELLRTKLEERGRSEREIRSMSAMKRIDSIADRLEQLRDGTWEDDRLAGVDTAYWRSWMKLGDSAPEIAAKLDRPLLVLSGTYDFHTPSPELRLWRETLESEETPADHRVVELECVTHALNCIEESNAMRVERSDLTRHVDARVVARIAQFVEDLD